MNNKNSRNNREHNYYVQFSIIVFLILGNFALAAILSKAEESSYVYSKTEDEIYETLLEKGYSQAGVCGILGNISVENPWFEPDLSANNGNNYGLFQWSDVGNRKSFLTRWCNNRLLYPNSVEGQLAYAIYELEGGDAQASRLNEFLKEVQDPELAAMEFAAGFERCVGETNHDGTDGVYTGEIYPEFKGRTYQDLLLRISHAKDYFEGYVGTEVSEDMALDVEGTPTAGIIAEKEDKMEIELLEQVPMQTTDNTGLMWLYRIICLAIGYLLGCVLGVSVIIRNAKKKEELHMDKHLPSLWTVLKHAGLKECFFATVIDVSKLCLALLICYYITKGALGPEQILWCGMGVILGNDFPFWHKFSGGMGLVVSTLMICMYMPIWGYLCCFLGLIVAILFKSIPFGTISISLFAVPYAFIFRGPVGGIFVILALAIMLYKHYHFLKRFISRKLLQDHYSRHRRTRRDVVMD